MVTKEIIRRFFIQKLASIISQHSEKGLPFSPEESVKIDWWMAERCIDRYFPHLVEETLQKINEEKPEKYDFADFEKGFGFMVWDTLFIRNVSVCLTAPFYENVWIYK
ncbi:MAG: hypothetical protein PHE24_00205 [Patescibacteria group bacterium]|nr:hypothetical protein [Patescibacteria group bacterium]